MKKWLKITIWLVVVIGIIGTMGKVAYYRYSEKLKSIAIKKKKEEINVNTPVAVAPVTRGDIYDSLVLTGRIFAKSNVSIFSTVPGKVKEVLISEGDEVKKDDILIYIDRSEAGLVYAPTPVKSTISGIVERVLVKEGAYIVPQNPLVRVMNIDRVEMYVNVPEREISNIRPGLKVKMKLIAYPDRTFTGRVSKLSPVVDPKTGTLEVRILMENPGHLVKPGMFGTAEIIVKKHSNTLIIPVASVLRRNNRDVVFIADGGVARMVTPVFGIQMGERIEVLKGLREGEKVIVIGQQNLNDGDRINITEEIR